MKFKSLFITALLILSTSAFAQWFPARVRVVVLPGQVAAEVFNPYYEPIVCNGQVLGQTIQGLVYNAFFNEQFLPIGGHRFAYVQTNQFAPFVSGWANIHCRFARYW